MQLVGIAGDVHFCDAATLDGERRRLENPSPLPADVAGQAINPDWLDETHPAFSEFAVEARIQAEDTLDADNRVEEGEHLAATIGPDHDLLRQQRLEGCDVAAVRCGKEGMGDPIPLIAFDRETRTGGLDVLARPGGKLADCRRLPLERGRNLLQWQTEDVVKKECGTLQ